MVELETEQCLACGRPLTQLSGGNLAEGWTDFGPKDGKST